MEILDNKCQYINLKEEKCENNIKGNRRKYCCRHHKIMTDYFNKYFDDHLEEIKKSYINDDLYKYK